MEGLLGRDWQALDVRCSSRQVRLHWYPWRWTTALHAINTLAHHGIVFIPLGYKNAFASLANVTEIHGGTPWGAGTFAGGDGSRTPTKLETSIAKTQGKTFWEIGKTTYWLLGPEDGIKILPNSTDQEVTHLSYQVVLIHGISTPCVIWRNVAPYWAEHGFRVLVYDLYGRGYSEAPDTVYNHDLYTIQLALLLKHIRWDSTHIIGLSTGGGVTSAFAALSPNLIVEKIVFLASSELRLKRVCVTADIDPEFVADPSHVLRLMSKLQRENLPGFTRAFASSLRYGPSRSLENAFKMIARTPTLKCCIIHGTGDRTVPLEAGKRIKKHIPSAQWVPIEGADHDLIVSPEYYEQIREEI
ncbi:benzoquinone reductase [Sphaerobolus stellatus SS14]|uniref:Benzoquinone reductase n=1 Tax=Sphaerobolus stellatus (strain SS14) TaxID=990650 RepID=A0A0C9U025_SPHS4|nr:benzoquinone reductase [Sphaerobolus stellatus SS14]